MSKKWRKSGKPIQAASKPTQLRIACGEQLELLAAEGEGGKLRKFTMNAYTGGAMNLSGFYSPVVVDLAGVSVPSQTRPILKDHSTENIVGHTDKIDVTAKTLKVSGVISGVGEAAQEVTALAANGFPWQASIGASVQKMEHIEAGSKVQVNGRTFHGPVSIARATTLGEVSFVAIGADPNSSASVAAGADIMSEFEKWLQANGFDAATLSDVQRAALQGAFDKSQSQKPAPAVTPPAPVIDINAELKAAREAAAAEAKRQADITRIVAKGEVKEFTAADKSTTDLTAHAIGENWTAEQTELYVLRASRPAGPAIISRSHERDCSIEAMQGAMILRAGGRLDHRAYQSPAAISLKLPQWMRAGINAEAKQRALEAAHRYADMSAVDLCREAIRLDNKSIPSGTRREMIQAAFSGSALNDIFTTSVNATLLATYMDAPDTTNGWTSTADVGDFKTNDRILLAKGPNLVKLPRGGEADHYDRSDVKESYKIARYAKQFVADEQDIIDDMLGALAQTPVEMGLAAARLRPDLVYALILRNAALDADSVALFHADHSNLNTSAGLTNANVTVCIAGIEKQRSNSINLNLRASHLIVPSDEKHDAMQIANSSEVLWGADNETALGNMNPIKAEGLTVIADSRLSNGVTDPVDGASQSGSTTTWYMASSMGHTIEVGYLRGTGRAPQVRSWTYTSEGKYGMGWDVSLDIGAKALDFRGMAKNTA